MGVQVGQVDLIDIGVEHCVGIEVCTPDNCGVVGSQKLQRGTLDGPIVGSRRLSVPMDNRRVHILVNISTNLDKRLCGFSVRTNKDPEDLGSNLAIYL